ncbi:alpha/beta hydrolase [Demequina aestuarii]|uniref:alpha/beta hydrolase n=1 Tax=Demequina aestuarii TaxID=327095 RepID=UPI0007837D1F|nr:alpha/beta fold hydrolase [Demequina aestuarii]
MDITAFTRSPDWDDARPPTGPVVVLLHGYGSHEGDLAGLAPWLPAGMPWISLRAPIPMPGAGFAWFPLTLPDTPPPAPIAAATAALWEWIDTHLGAETALIPMGFSQGGLMALQLLRTRPERIAATVVLAGFVTDAPQPPDALLSEQRPRVFWGRGGADPVIPSDAVTHTAEFLPRHSTLTERVYSGLGHAVDHRVLDDVRSFLDASTASRGAGQAG